MMLIKLIKRTVVNGELQKLRATELQKLRCNIQVSDLDNQVQWLVYLVACANIQYYK